MKRGVQLYTVRDFMNTPEQVQESLAKIKAMGYDSVQAWTPPFLNHRDFRRMIADSGLDTYCANADFAAMESDPQALPAAVEQAGIYGEPFLAIGTLPKELRESEEGYRDYARRVNVLCAKLKKEGIRLLYHPHALECFSLGGGRKGIDILLEETDPDGFWFTLDTHWLQSGGLNVCQWIEKVRGRMQMIHFKDYAIVGGAETIETVCKNFAEVGEGNLDWPAIIAACKQNGVLAAVVEQDTCAGDPFDSLQKSYRNMERLGV